MVQVRKRAQLTARLVGGHLSRRGLRPVRVGTTGAARSSLAIALALSALTACAAPAANHITVTREVFLERGQPVSPGALARTSKGDYVIAGRYENRGWAIQVTPAGRVQWTYIGPKPEVRGGRSAVTTFTGVAALPDGSTLLCGHREGPRNSVTAVLTLLGSHGQVLSRQTLYPNGDHRYVLNYFYRCVRWGHGVAVLGSTHYVWGHSVPRREKGYDWVLRLDTDGHVEWEKLLRPLPKVMPRPMAPPLVLTNGDLLASLGGKLVLIGPRGAIKAQRVDIGPVVPSVGQQKSVHALVRNTWHVLGGHLQTVRIESLPGHMGLSPAPIAPKRMYRLPDGAIALFGYTEHGPSSASIGWLSPDQRQRAVLRFKRKASTWITDAVPTGSPGEFATVRPVWPLMHPYEKYDPNQAGIVLDFVHIHP